MELKALKVYEVNHYIKRVLVSDPVLYNIKVEGEISNFKHHYSGHMYFTLKDDSSRIRCVMFNGDNNTLQFNPEDGMKVVITGYISVYEKDGSYQLYAKDMIPKGKGDLFNRFEMLKKKLSFEGLFKEEHKKSIPFLPKKIGVVTSSTGAAVRDIITVIKRRQPSADIIIYPVLVQGDKAPFEICKGLSYFNSREDIDLIITGRGGGSIEELWAFNEEIVAREIYNLSKPIISAVGHETDFTIADFVADLRAPTPSAAGEMATPNLEELKERLTDINIRLEIVYKSYLNNIENKLSILKSSLWSNSPLNEIKNKKQELITLRKDLFNGIKFIIKDSKKDLDNLGEKLNTLSPLSTLNRGYSVVSNKDRKIIRSIEETDIDDIINVLLKDGELQCRVIDKIKDNKKGVI